MASRNLLRTTSGVRSLLTCCRCTMHETSIPSLTIAMQQQRRTCATAAAPKEYPEHIVNVVETISKLTLGEVATLNTLLKEKLNIADAPMMPMMGAPGMVAAAGPAEAEDEAEAVPEVVEQTEFTVKLVSFDAGKKVKLVKEIKNCFADFNLVQAKKFVDAGPQVVKEGLTKDEAETMKKGLEEAGAVVEVV